jgi:hypothetical protein
MEYRKWRAGQFCASLSVGFEDGEKPAAGTDVIKTSQKGAYIKTPGPFAGFRSESRPLYIRVSEVD